ncbi:MAG TPA: proton-conducting transporter membrane subunit, partial [Solirubrobacteraceae bacterium]
FVALGVVTALLGAWMCFAQRHIKRLLAFSTISHLGMFVSGVALLSAKGLAGVAVWVVGHGLAKAALFMCAGVLLHRFATIDEYDLHGRGKELPIVGILFAAGGLLLAEAPPFTAFHGKSLVESAAMQAGYGWLIPVFIIASALTGGAVLRVAGRVFLGWGPSEGPDPSQARAAEEPVDEERYPREDTPPLMVIVPALLLVAGAVAGLIPEAVAGVERQAARFVDHAGYAAWVLHGIRTGMPNVVAETVKLGDVGYGLLTVLGAVAVGTIGLFGRPLAASFPRAVSSPAGAGLRALRHLHSGHIGDYIAWWTAGTGVLGGVCLVALR